MFEFIGVIIVGILAGVFTGLVPGIHINLIAAFIVAALPSLTPHINPLPIAIFIVVMSITHTFLDFIPSVYLGAPEEDSMLAVLPGHTLLNEGKGHDAIVLTLIGSCAALIVIAVGTPLFIVGIPKVYELTKTLVPFGLALGSAYILLREKNPVLATLIFCFAGILGYATLNLPVEQPLLPLLSGLFGISGLLVSINQQPTIPKQTIRSIREIMPGKIEILKATGAASSTAPLCAFLPGFGAGHAAVLAAEVSSDEPKKFLMLVGAINTIVMGLSFATLFAINRTRTGSAAAVGTILPDLSKSTLFILVACMILAGVIATCAATYISKMSANMITRIPYRLLSWSIISALLFITFLLSNTLGMLVLITASSLGVYGIISGVRRISFMGVLIIPTLIYFFK